jgi:serine/threonine-protein kinase
MPKTAGKPDGPGRSVPSHPSTEPGADNDTFRFDSPLAPPATSPSGIDALRFQPRGCLGLGGMGEVLRVFDPTLRREVALKIAHAHTVRNEALRERFIEEAQIQAQLQHPNLVPVHEMGTLGDGRPWFTMDLIRGDSLQVVIDRVQGASLHAWGVDPTGWSLRRLLSTLAAAAHAVGYAHDQGVTHRDLKPQNLMVGVFGEVRVVDWGLAKVRGRPEPSAFDLDENEPASSIITVRSENPNLATQMGSVSGTPAYMAPEQAQGRIDLLGPATDVYALGAILYHILAGHPPYHFPGTQPNARELLKRALRGPPPPLRDVARLPIPDELDALVAQAMARDPADRPPNGAAFAATLDVYLDGSRRQELARSIVEAADATQPQAAALRAEAAQRRAGAHAALAATPTWAPATDKAGAWSEEDAAASLDRKAALLDGARRSAYVTALSHAADNPEAHCALAAVSRARLSEAEAARDPDGAATAAQDLRAHLLALPLDHPKRVEGLRFLDGAGTLTLALATPGATLHLDRLIEHQRRLVAEPAGPLALGLAVPFTAPIGRGSWRLRIHAPGHAAIHYPFFIRRNGDWIDRDPRTGTLHPLRLPRAEDIGPHEVFIPGGWFSAGGDPRAPGNPLSAREVWIDPFVLDLHPITHGDWLQFLNALCEAGREAEALRHAPRLLAASASQQGALLYTYEDGRFSLPSPSRDHWTLSTPVCLIDWFGAQAYAQWRAQSTGLPYRLPDELEREKAARGVDGRLYPWGDRFDPSRCNMRDSHPGGARPVEVHAFPEDESVYGVRGLAGNTLDWTATPYVQAGLVADGAALTLPPEPPAAERYVTRGGAWADAASSARAATRYNLPPHMRLDFLGLRLARTIQL